MEHSKNLANINTDGKINTSELFFILDSLKNGAAKVSDFSVYNESRNYTVTVELPSGECFHISEYLGVIYYVRRIEKENDNG